jgi:hypothetical protein
LAALTRSSSRGNPAAKASVVLGALAVAAIPVAVVASRYVPSVRLLQGLYVAVPSALVLGFLAVRAARRAHRTIGLTLGRAGGERASRTGRALALLGLYLGAMGALALASPWVSFHDLRHARDATPPPAAPDATP